MEQEAVVYGCIKTPSSSASNEQYRHRMTNRRAILALPTMNQSWGFLSQDIFKLPPSATQLYPYHTDVIHFGASYQAIESQWKQWVTEFESLLKQMYWSSVAVHLNTEFSGTHDFTWETSTLHQPGGNPLSVRCQWSHEVGITEKA